MKIKPGMIWKPLGGSLSEAVVLEVGSTNVKLRWLKNYSGDAVPSFNIADYRIELLEAGVEHGKGSFYDPKDIKDPNLAFSLKRNRKT